jgi:hypothetical protein
MILYRNPYRNLPPVAGWNRALRLSGLGVDCPEFAPYESGGRCSNVPPGVDASRDVFVQTPDTRPEDVPSGYFMNPFTGVVEVQTAIQEASRARGSGAGEIDRSNAELEAREAERFGRARGLNVGCEVRANCGPGTAGGSPTSETSCLYWADCTVNGSAGHDAGLLLYPGGWESAVVEIARESGHPLTSVPMFTNPAAVQRPSGPSGSPAAPASSSPTSGPAALRSAVNLVPVALGPPSSVAPELPPGIDALIRGISLKNWVLLGVAVVGVGFMLTRK